MPTNNATIHLTILGSDPQPIKDFIDSAIEHNMDKDTDKIGIYEMHRWDWCGWVKA